jgi:hypothetical protein
MRSSVYSRSYRFTGTSDGGAMQPVNSGFRAIIDKKHISFFVDRENPSGADTADAPMARFIYVIHCEYQDPADPHSLPAPISPGQFPQALGRFPAELRTYFQDPGATMSVESLEDDPNAIQVIVMTTLSETLADAAFVRFVQNCSLAHDPSETRTRPGPRIEPARRAA